MQPPSGGSRHRKKQGRAGAEYSVRRDEYLADERVAGFTRWARQLATENLKLEDRGTSRGTVFCCASLYDTLEKYRWPNNRYSLEYWVTAQKLRDWRFYGRP